MPPLSQVFRDFPQRTGDYRRRGPPPTLLSPTPESMAEQGFIVQSRAQSTASPSYRGRPRRHPRLRIFASGSVQRHRCALPRDDRGAAAGAVGDRYTPELSNQPTGARPVNLGQPGSRRRAGQFDTPVGIVHTATRRHLRPRQRQPGIQRFSGDGKFIGVWDGGTDPNLAFATAFDMGPTGLAVSSDDLVYIADTWNHRVVVVDRSGTFVREIGQRGGQTDLGDNPDPNVDTGRSSSTRVPLTRADLVTDTGNEACRSSPGRHLLRASADTHRAGKLLEPTGIAVDRTACHIADLRQRWLSVFERGAPR